MNSRYRVTISEEPGIGELALGILALVLFLGVIAAAAGGIILVVLLLVGLVSLIVKNPEVTIVLLVIAGIGLVIYFIVTRVPVVSLVTGLGGLVGLITYVVARMEQDDEVGWFGAAFAAVSGAVAVYIGGIIGSKAGELVRYILENETSLLPFQIAGYIIAAIWVIKSFWALPVLVVAAGTMAIIAGVVITLLTVFLPVSSWLHVDSPKQQFLVTAVIAMFVVTVLPSIIRILIATTKNIGKIPAKSVLLGILLGLLLSVILALLNGILEGVFVGASGPMLFDLVTTQNNKITRLLMSYPTVVSAMLGGAASGLFWWSQLLNSVRKSY